MTANVTVVFADLTGSTAMFEKQGNARATEVITGLTQLMGEVFVKHQGRVVKFLGDGVLALFANSLHALEAVTDLQRSLHLRSQGELDKAPMQVRIGVATGEVLEVDGEHYGEALTLAARLSELSGAEQIWATASTVDALPSTAGPRRRRLGPIAIRGKTEPQVVYQIEWQEELPSEFLTLPGNLQYMASQAAALQATIVLSWLDVQAGFVASPLPIYLGRGDDAAFAVNDPRVSRLHAKINWVNGKFVLTDLSSYGTWLRFAGSESELALRRSACALHSNGEIAMGAPFSDFTVPTVNFKLSG
ncbi:MAG: FHA domain-containing protein [Rhodoferax sp.]|nr:FHA domain-containing protein [Rhodoferax sp.]